MGDIIARWWLQEGHRQRGQLLPGLYGGREGQCGPGLRWREDRAGAHHWHAQEVGEGSTSRGWRMGWQGVRKWGPPGLPDGSGAEGWQTRAGSCSTEPPGDPESSE